MMKECDAHSFPQPEAQAGAEVGLKRGISQHFVVVVVQRIVHVGVCGDVAIDVEPAAKVKARVAGSVSKSAGSSRRGSRSQDGVRRQTTAAWRRSAMLRVGTKTVPACLGRRRRGAPTPKISGSQNGGLHGGASMMRVEV